MSDTQFFPSTRGFDLNQQRLSLLIQLTERICGVFERKQLLEEALDACCDALGFERGLVVLKTQRGDTELPVARNVQRDETGAFKVSRTLINRALIQGERAIVNNPATDLDGNLSESLVRFPICSALCVPILNRGDVLGAIYGDRITQGSTYSAEDVDFLAAIAQQVGVGITNLKLFKDHAQSQAVYAELQRARVIQQELLPASPLSSGCMKIQGTNEPSSAVSGDYFDYFSLGDDKIGIIIADVTGHGLPAALVMANLQSARAGRVDFRHAARRTDGAYQPADLREHGQPVVRDGDPRTDGCRLRQTRSGLRRSSGTDPPACGRERRRARAGRLAAHSASIRARDSR